MLSVTNLYKGRVSSMLFVLYQIYIEMKILRVIYKLLQIKYVRI